MVSYRLAYKENSEAGNCASSCIINHQIGGNGWKMHLWCSPNWVWWCTCSWRKAWGKEIVLSWLRPAVETKRRGRGRWNFHLLQLTPNPLLIFLSTYIYVNSVNHTKCHVNEQHRAVSGRLWWTNPDEGFMGQRLKYNVVIQSTQS